MSPFPVRRVVLWAVAQLCCAGLMSDAARAGGWPIAWSDLWRTADQQGQAMLDAGEPALAAARFRDPRRRAYADLEAGRYPQAAKLLAPFNDAQSEYNDGNALAGSGQLQAALAAYDAALKLAPTDKDIRHNRDLVERALRQRQQSRQNGSGSRQSGARSSQTTGSGQMGSNGSRGAAGQSASSSQQPNAPQAAREHRGGGSQEASGEAQRDATFAAAAARAQQQQGGSRSKSQAQAPSKGAARGPDADKLVAGGTETPKQEPETERQLMLDQWLRQIPDSPAGLLRRQFLIQHMMRQQDGADSQGSGQ
jgi:Ca-activated chloride channel homolog